jgi:hypothetical protein
VRWLDSPKRDRGNDGSYWGPASFCRDIDHSQGIGALDALWIELAGDSVLLERVAETALLVIGVGNIQSRIGM